MPLYVWNGSEYVRIDDGSGNLNAKNKMYDTDLDGIVDQAVAGPHTHVRADISDFFSSPFWDNIPDKPSEFPPEAHTHSRSDISDFFSSPFWGNIPDRPPIGVVPDDGDIQTVINNLYNNYGGGIVIIKPGTYDVSATIKIPDNIVIIGYGAILRATASGVILSNADTTNGNKNIVIEGITIDGNNGTGYRGIYFGLVKNAIIKNVEIYGLDSHGIYMNNCENIIVQGCEIHDTTSSYTVNGILALNSNRIIVINCIVYNYTSGIRLGADPDFVERSVVDNCIVRNISVSYGIRVDGYDNIVRNCLVELCREEGIMLYGDRNKAIGNTARNCDRGGGGWAGIEISGNRNIVANNTCYDDQGTPTQDYGIREYSGDYNLIIGNICWGNAVQNILVQGTNSLSANNIT